MQEIGKLLKSKRCSMNLSLNYVAGVLKIRARYLDGLERWDFRNLPEKVYIIGYLKIYANFVGLDGENIASQFKEHYTDYSNLQIKEVFQEDSLPNIPTIVTCLLLSLMFLKIYDVKTSHTPSETSPVLLSKLNIN